MRKVHQQVLHFPPPPKKSPTKIHQFDPSVRRQQDVVALDVAVDGLVDVKVLEALRGSEREQTNHSHTTPATLLSGVRKWISRLRPSAGRDSP